MEMFHENLQKTSQKKSGVSAWVLVLIIIITFFVAFFVFKNLDTIGTRFSGGTESGVQLKVGQSVSLT